jgi:IS5 family transposase
VSHRSIGQERFGFAGRNGSGSSLDELGELIDWDEVSGLLDLLYSATKGEPAWPLSDIASCSQSGSWIGRCLRR